MERFPIIFECLNDSSTVEIAFLTIIFSHNLAYVYMKIY